jgi:UDP-N-acetylmuramoyl-L-alanyl-D-glutamate--2,6-diaminopimelate ligase
MTSPDVFELQRLFSIAKNKWCEIAVIETASHWIKMNRIWWIDYDVSVLTNISRDHLDLHKTMKDYVNTKLKIFKNLITYNRKPWVKKTAIINSESKYSELFLNETYDTLLTYWNTEKSDLKFRNLKSDLNWMKFTLDIAGPNIEVETPLRWEFNAYNLLAAIWVFVTFNIKKADIKKIIKEIQAIPGRMEEIENNLWYKIFVDYAHTPDALEKVLENLNQSSWINRIITVFWATWDRDKEKRPIMWEIASRLSDCVILTQDDDYSEDSEDIIKDVLPWIERKQSEDFWIISDRKEAIRTALIMAKENDVVIIAWKWDEHTMVTNNWTIQWHDKSVVLEILKGIDDNQIIK